MKVDIVIVTHNSAATITRCLESLPKEAHVIVVDNASQDNTVAVLASAGVTYHRVAQNLGFASGANQGAKFGKSPYIFFLNPDAYLNEPSLEPALTYLTHHPSVAALGFRLVSPAGEPEISFGPPVTLLSLLTTRRRLPKVPAKPTPVGWVSGGALLVRRTMFERAGGFDPQFFLYWEDIDLSARLQSQGGHVVYFPAVQVVHQRGRSLASPHRKTQLYDESADKYFRKYYSPKIWGLHRFLRRLYRYFSPVAH